MKKVRIGILSTAGIARKNWQAIRDTGNSVVSAVASRDVERSCSFVAENQKDAPFEVVPEAFGSYEALIQSSAVDAIYIPLPTGLRKEWVLRAAAAGKHVVCEKPCGTSDANLAEMIETCRKNKVQFMDGVMFMHNPRLDRIRQALDDGKSVGGIKRISSMFSFLGNGNFFTDNIRLHSDLEPAGCLGDLGWYCIRFTLWAMNWRLPREVTGRILTVRGASNSPSPVPADFSAELVFDDNTSASFFCSFLTGKQQWVHISGDKGSLSFPDFVHPHSDHEPSFELNADVIRVKCCDCTGAHTASRSMAQDVNLFRNFAVQIQSAKLKDDWPMQALKTQQVLDVCLKSANAGGRVMEVSAD